MNKREVSPVVKTIWLTSLVYLFVLLVGFGFLLPDDVYLPEWEQLAFKVSAVVAFLVVVVVPLAHLFSKRHSKALGVAAIVTLGAYALLFAQMIYVKVKTCDDSVFPHDARWHCNVSGKGIAASIILIPLLAAVIGVLFVALNRQHRKPPHG